MEQTALMQKLQDLLSDFGHTHHVQLLLFAKVPAYMLEALHLHPASQVLLPGELVIQPLQEAQKATDGTEG